MNNIAIVGGGPSGIYCALNILFAFKSKNFNEFNLTIFDKGQILRTILPTGNGRCNITNSIYDIDEFITNYPRGQKFLYSLFARHFNYDSLEFFKSIGIECYTQDDNRMFPKSNSAKDVKDKMLNALKKFKNVKLINKNISNPDELKDFDYVIISAGSRQSENLINGFNHNLIPFKKALCALVLDNFIYPKGVSVKSLDGEFVFTQNGISGPLAFKISSLNAYSDFPYEHIIRLFEVNDLIQEINNNPKKSIGNIVSKFIPRSFAQVLIKDFDKKSAEVSKKDMINMANFKIKVLSTTPFGEIVNAGGVDLSQLDKNCKSKICENLWFCGEILDIDGFCGGFNLQNCWSSAFVVANDVVDNIIKK